MPLYEYKCPSCKEKFDALKPLRDRDEPTDCPECGETAERVTMSAFATGGASSGGVSAGASRASCGFSGG